MESAVTLGSLYGPVQSELDAVRDEVRHHWDEAFRLVYGLSAEPPELGGKLIRPALCLLSAGVSGSNHLSDYIPMATAMEMLHLAALAHDDVVDSAVLRRGNSSLNALWDNHTAVLGGDYLVARALSVLTHYDSCPVIACALESIHEMAEGELINFGRARGELKVKDSLLLAEKKTASLFAVSCKISSLLLNKEYSPAFHDFGMGVGTAFQLVDDLLDLAQDEDVLGKPSCGDVVEGKKTVPILTMMERMDSADAVKFASIEGNPLTDDDRLWIRERLRATGADRYTEDLARQYLDRGLAALELLPGGEYRESMAGLAEFVVVRDC